MIGLQHSIISPTLDESTISDPNPIQLAINLSKFKAMEVAENNQFELLIAADTIVVLDDLVLGKPRDTAEAFSMLTSLSGNTHSVITGVTLVNSTMEIHSFHVITNVTFCELTPNEITSYISGGSPMDKAGAYGIQDDLGSLFVERIEGDYYNVVGFPVNRFYTELKSFVPHIAQDILKQSFTIDQ